MENDEQEVAVLRVRFARRGSVRVASVLGGLLLLASPFIDDLIRANTQQPNVAGAEMDGHHHELEWTRMMAKPSSKEHCDHECRTWGTELAAHVSFGF